MRTPRWSLTLLLVLGAATLGAVAFGAAGCGTGSDGSATPGTPSPSSGSPDASQVIITRTGGLAGVNQTIVITVDGGWTFTDNKTGATQQGTLTDTVRGQLLAQVADPGFAAQLLSTASAGNCADTFHYTIKFGGQSLSFDECDQANRPAVMAVIATVTDATPF